LVRWNSGSGEKRLPIGQASAILTSDGRPLVGCRATKLEEASLKTVAIPYSDLVDLGVTDMLKYFAVIVAFGALIGCVSVKTSVDAYSSISDDLEPKTVYLAPYKGMDDSSLQWQANAKILASILEEKGYQVVSQKGQARLTAFFGFAIDKGERVLTSYSIPQWGVTGYTGANTYGTAYGNTYSATTTLNPTYGVTGYNSGVSSNVVYTRSVAIDMVDNKTGQKVFQSSGVSRGSCASFTGVSKPIIGSILSNFPEGKIGTVQVPTDTDC
jgi:hypothetical protein